VVGTIYAFSTVGSIIGTFLTGYFFILWFGTRTVVWLVAAILIITGILSWFLWRVPERWKASATNLVTWIVVVAVILGAVTIYQFPKSWQEVYTKESNYYAIKVITENGNKKVLLLDHLVHSYVYPDNPAILDYGYEKTFTEIAQYVMQNNPNPRVLHLGGGGYSFSRYMATVYPGSVNEVVEIDPEVTRVAYSELGLPPGINIKTYNRDARLFLIQKNSNEKYDIVAADVFNDFSTPFHLTTLEFDRLVKNNLSENGIYMINIIDDFQNGQYIPSFIHTLKQVFKHVSLFTSSEDWDNLGLSTFVIAASDHYIDPAEYEKLMHQRGSGTLSAFPSNESALDKYLGRKNPILLTDDHAPTDILIAPFIGKR
jgi:spermidine synthase